MTRQTFGRNRIFFDADYATPSLRQGRGHCSSCGTDLENRPVTACKQNEEGVGGVGVGKVGPFVPVSKRITIHGMNPAFAVVFSGHRLGINPRCLKFSF